MGGQSDSEHPRSSITEATDPEGGIMFVFEHDIYAVS